MKVRSHIENQRRINKCILYAQFPFCEMRSLEYNDQSQMLMVNFASQEVTLRDFVEYDIDDLIIPVHGYTLMQLGFRDVENSNRYYRGGFCVYEVDFNDVFYLEMPDEDVLLTDIFHLKQLINL